MVTRGEDGLARVGVRHDMMRRLKPGSTLRAPYRVCEIDVVEGESVWLVCGDQQVGAVVRKVERVFDPHERLRVAFTVKEG